MPKTNLSFDQFNAFDRQILTVESFLRCPPNNAALLRELVMEGLAACHENRIELVMSYAVHWDCSFATAWFMIVTGETPPLPTKMSEKEIKALIIRIKLSGLRRYFRHSLDF